MTGPTTRPPRYCGICSTPLASHTHRGCSDECRRKWDKLREARRENGEGLPEYGGPVRSDLVELARTVTRKRWTRAARRWEIEREERRKDEAICG